jgi:hypothetical protein
MTGRLTPAEKVDRATSGAELQRLVTELAHIYGWQWVHFRPAQTQRGWRTPVEGPLGKGWPDLFLAHPRKRRLLAVEIKREHGDPLTADQAAVLHALAASGLETVVWRPSDLTAGRVQAALQ